MGTTTEDKTIAKAREIGAERGKSAASWVFDGNTDLATYRRVLKGIEDCDPEVLDGLPYSDLSGEWADGYTVDMLAKELDVPWDDIDTLADAYEASFFEAVCDELAAFARLHLDV
jgi:hypothetical protein